MSRFRASPTTRRAMTAEQRAEMRSLDDDLTVTVWPDTHWTSSGDRLWICRIARGQVTVAERAADTIMGAFRRARGMLERAAV